ncbi:MAG: hypothetical protein ACHP9Z_34295, partial [Streptosporangiales bacterium]
ARQQAEDARTALEAQQRAQAQQVIGDALAAERQALDGIQEALSDMYACLGAAQDAFRRAQASEDEAGHARRRQMDGRIMAGDMQPPGPRVQKPNAASVLLERDHCIRLLMQWRR